MNRLKLMAMIWVSGLIAGLVLVERWRRMGQPLVAAPALEPAAEPAEATPAADTSVKARAQATASHVGATAQKAAGQVSAGAKADVARVRHLFQRHPATSQA